MGMKKKIGLFAALAGVTAAGAYNYVKGNGIFNKRRFKSQHEAVARYLEAHYPGAEYSPIKAEDEGWVTIITTADDAKIALSITRCEDNVYIFKETPITE